MARAKNVSGEFIIAQEREPLTLMILWKIEELRRLQDRGGQDESRDILFNASRNTVLRPYFIHAPTFKFLALSPSHCVRFFLNALR